MTNDNFSTQLLNWFDQYGRKDLPWQHQPTPYSVWVSEIMLQQTQVKTVIPFYQTFIRHYQNISSLANASIDDVLSLWTGLGYYARARNLHKTATIIHNDYDDEMPNSLEALIALPGIGRSTAGAIMALAHHQYFPILDGNVKRVLARYKAISGWPGNKAVEQLLWQHAEQLLPNNRIAHYIQAQMDLGATICTRIKPECEMCPLHSDCMAFQQGNSQDYPSPKPKKVIPIRKTNWIVAQSGLGEVLLEQRPNSGIWGGLWSFPEIDTTENIQHICQHQLNLNTINISVKPHFRHVFSHFKLDITPHIIQCNNNDNHISENKNISWYKISDALRLGLPAPVKSFLKTL
ncbi:MAG: A/G-specific adenine glycosylase [Gammaproteobacteria bacterium]|nr:MAG: A/G-specific adenine glycosylase [Gammaproteobacteria bacterium]RKZ94472.1 MAG: A/G-specific adenine glycosylase [Gammaproteobacteria bacterium]RLA02226.1 MAG: A/G-specific adenine glycosylase [Gammaproteobacteria bacterium]